MSFNIGIQLPNKKEKKFDTQSQNTVRLGQKHSQNTLNAVFSDHEHTFQSKDAVSSDRGAKRLAAKTDIIDIVSDEVQGIANSVEWNSPLKDIFGSRKPADFLIHKKKSQSEIASPDTKLRRLNKFTTLTPILDALEVEMKREEQLKQMKAYYKNRTQNRSLNLLRTARAQNSAKKAAIIESNYINKGGSLQNSNSLMYSDAKNEMPLTKDRAGLLTHSNQMFVSSKLKNTTQIAHHAAALQQPPFKVGAATSRDFYKSIKNEFRTKEAPLDFQPVHSDKQYFTEGRPHAEKKIFDFPDTNPIDLFQVNFVPLRSSFIWTNKLNDMAVSRNKFLGISNLQIKPENNMDKIIKNFEQHQPEDDTNYISPQVSQQIYRAYLEKKFRKLQEEHENSQARVQAERSHFVKSSKNFSKAALSSPKRTFKESSHNKQLTNSKSEAGLLIERNNSPSKEQATSLRDSKEPSQTIRYVPPNQSASSSKSIGQSQNKISKQISTLEVSDAFQHSIRHRKLFVKKPANKYETTNTSKSLSRNNSS